LTALGDSYIPTKERREGLGLNDTVILRGFDCDKVGVDWAEADWDKVHAGWQRRDRYGQSRWKDTCTACAHGWLVYVRERWPCHCGPGSCIQSCECEYPLAKRAHAATETATTR